MEYHEARIVVTYIHPLSCTRQTRMELANKVSFISEEKKSGNLSSPRINPNEIMWKKRMN